METKTIIFKDVLSLRRGFKVANIFSYPDDFRLEMAILTKEEVARYNSQLESYSSDCGCQMAKLFLGAFILLYSIAWFAGILPLPTHNHLLNYVLFAIVGASIGKGFSLMINHYKISQVIREIDGKVMARRPQKRNRRKESSYAMA